MNLFFTQNIQNGIARFDEEESRHLFVMRKKIGDLISFTDGKGFFYEGKIMELGKKNISLSVESQRAEEKSNARHLHIAIAPTKNIDRIEWFLEKSTELGINEVTFLLCKNAERDKIRLDRLEKIVESAMKQSLQATLPKLNDFTKFEDFIKKNNTFDPDYQGFIAYCNVPDLVNYPATTAKNQTVLIGPEGDFTPKEVELALKNNYKGISLGKNRLRTETAGLYVSTVFYAKNDSIES
jgi:16S rRNA (uracil1498-N3)-methyltransferase